MRIHHQSNFIGTALPKYPNMDFQKKFHHFKFRNQSLWPKNANINIAQNSMRIRALRDRVYSSGQEEAVQPSKPIGCRSPY